MADLVERLMVAYTLICKRDPELAEAALQFAEAIVRSLQKNQQS